MMTLPLALSLLACAAGTGGTADSTDTAGADTAADTAGETAAPPDGETLYGDNCSVCHGDDGKGVRNQGPDIAREIGKLSDTQIIEIILNGKGRNEMPPIDVTEAEAQLIVDYARATF